MRGLRPVSSPELLSALKNLDSDSATMTLISTFPIEQAGWSEALPYIPRLGLKKCDQKKLAEYYMQQGPFQNARPYTVLLRMLTESEIKALAKCETMTDEDRDFFHYQIAIAAHLLKEWQAKER